MSLELDLHLQPMLCVSCWFIPLDYAWWSRWEIGFTGFYHKSLPAHVLRGMGSLRLHPSAICQMFSSRRIHLSSLDAACQRGGFFSSTLWIRWIEIKRSLLYRLPKADGDAGCSQAFRLQEVKAGFHWSSQTPLGHACKSPSYFKLQRKTFFPSCCTIFYKWYPGLWYFVWITLKNSLIPEIKHDVHS